MNKSSVSTKEKKRFHVFPLPSSLSSWFSSSILPWGYGSADYDFWDGWVKFVAAEFLLSFWNPGLTTLNYFSPCCVTFFLIVFLTFQQQPMATNINIAKVWTDTTSHSRPSQSSLDHWKRYKKKRFLGSSKSLWGLLLHINKSSVQKASSCSFYWEGQLELKFNFFATFAAISVWLDLEVGGVAAGVVSSFMGHIKEMDAWHAMNAERLSQNTAGHYSTLWKGC